MNIINRYLSSLLSYLGLFGKRQTMAIDFASGKTRILFSSQKKIFVQPTCIAIHSYYNQVLSVGEKADRLFGKTSKNVDVSYPLLGNKLSNKDNLSKFFDQLIEILAIDKLRFKVYVAKPWQMSKVHRDNLTQIIRSKLGEVEYVDRNYATYFYLVGRKKIGADACIITINDHLSEMTAFSQGKKIYQSGLNWGQRDYVLAIIDQIKKQYQVLISLKTAEQVLSELSSSSEESGEVKMTIRGKNLITNLPDVLQISSTDFHQVFFQQSLILIEELSNFLGNLDPDLLSLVLDQGVILSGPGQKIKGLVELIEKECKCKVYLPEPDDDLVVKGVFLYGQDKA